MKCRKNVRDLSAGPGGEKAAYVQAVIGLKTARPSIIAAAQAAGATSRYDDYVWIHREVMGGAHTGPAFTPWHREFLKQFERDLQEVSGNPDLTIPYWDWTTARTAADPGWPFTDDFMGGRGTGADNRVMTGRFAEAGGEWVLNVRTGAVGGVARDNTTYLRRLPSPPILPNGQPLQLPTQTTARNGLARLAYDADPWLEDPATLTLAQANASFRKFLEYLLHNGPHGWVGGNMMPMTSPNDPIFFLHHCNIDRLWAVWQQKHAPPVTNYLPSSGTTAQHDIDDVMGLLVPGNFAWPVAGRPMDVLDHRALGSWYASDLPFITPVTPSVNFGNVPENLTTYRPVQFTVQTCQPVTFRTTLLSGGNYSVPADQASVTVTHGAGASVTANIYIQFQASGPLSTAQAGQVRVQATITDVDGYFAAAAGGEHPAGSWDINLSAIPAPKPRTAVSFVLDRSGSMWDPAGAAGTKYDLLKESLQVVADIMQDNDAVGLVSFDELVASLAPITQMGPLPPGPGTGRGNVVAAIGSPDLVPRGLTGIGSGMIQGAADLNAERSNPATPYTQFAMVVMTDGNENVDPRVTHAPVTTAISGFSNNVFAIGLGTPGNVSDATLGAIARYMLVTGDMSSSVRRFRLSKYFVQVLAGATRTAIIVDPQGDLHLGVEHRIPFEVSETDVSIDVIALCPFAWLLDFSLETPDGTVIDSAAVSPNVRYYVQQNDAFYRINLPALPAAPDTSHAGRWTTILRVSDRSLRELLREQEGARESANLVEVITRLRKEGTLPYSLIVQSYSSLMMDAQVYQSGTEPGAELKLYAALNEYDVPIDGRANVVVEITEPDGTTVQVRLNERAPGRFGATHTTTIAGLYHCQFRAEGYTRHGTRFTREETRTAGVFKERAGGDERNERPGQHREGVFVARERESDKRGSTEGEIPERLRELIEDVEGLGIMSVPERHEPHEREEHEHEEDPHVHLDTFPVFVVEGDDLVMVDMDEAVRRADVARERQPDDGDDKEPDGHDHGDATR